MSTPAAPIKTPLGHDELRRRTRAFGQRHRTILFLVDGRRPLAEVLSLARQAGAQTSHFEELVRLGLIEIPSETMAPDPVLTVPGGLDMVRVTSVELDLPAAVALPLTGVQAELPFEEIDFVSPRPVAPIEPSAQRATNADVRAPPTADAGEGVAPTSGPMVEPIPSGASAASAESPLPPSAEVLESLANVTALAEQRNALSAAAAGDVGADVAAPAQSAMPGPMARMPPQPGPKAVAPRRTAQRASHGAQAIVARTAPAHKPKATPSRRTPARDHSRPRADTTRANHELAGEPLFQHVRDLLIEALRLDSPLLRARTATRVRSARSSTELIELVWEIEKRLSHARQSRHELLSLHRARELLGLGNTVVAGEGLSSRY